MFEMNVYHNRNIAVAVYAENTSSFNHISERYLRCIENIRHCKQVAHSLVRVRFRCFLCDELQNGNSLPDLAIN